MNQIFKYLARFNRREQTILIVGVAAVVVYLFWMVLLVPLQERRETQIQANTSAALSLGRVQVLAARLERASQNGQRQGSGGDISRLVDSSLQANGLRMAGFQPGTGGEVRVRLERMPYDRVMQWLYDLEYRHEVSIQDLTLSPTTDEGLVSVNIRLQQR
ncbi:type II secretion system protein GspM [Marinimicrobium alkaliphilum]|uniref:type II secretion system protein GspM n=1 Tax=Marinimicrobium alkaliphilum TaxID=2202654 RepID=UPI000DB969E9|nr:type II secretion system protein M [Marinimicrobium alkaliphilum]